MEEEAPEPEAASAPTPFSSSLSNAAHATRVAATQTKEAAPFMPLGSQSASSSADKVFTSPLVTKDELIEGSKMSLSAQD